MSLEATDFFLKKETRLVFIKMTPKSNPFAMAQEGVCGVRPKCSIHLWQNKLINFNSKHHFVFDTLITVKALR